MSRPLRINIEGGWYHVFGRGIERRNIFGDYRDREHFLELLSKLHSRYRIRIHAFALMDNHHHCILETPEGNLSAGMQWFHGSYSAWFNARHHRVGPLFQGRFRSIPVQNSGWAYNLSLYVHLNPLRIAGLGLDRQGRVSESKGWREPTGEQVRERLSRLRGYRWSSYRSYGGYCKAPEWLETGELLGRAHRKSDQRRGQYREDIRYLLSQGVDAGMVERLRDAVAIGSGEFAARMRRLAG